MIESVPITKDYSLDRRLQMVKDVLGMLTDEGGRIFSPARLDEISKTILFWIDEVNDGVSDSDCSLAR